MEKTSIGENAPDNKNGYRGNIGKKIKKNIHAYSTTKKGGSKKESIPESMSLTEKFIFVTLLLIMATGAGSLLWEVQSSLLVTIPAYDGTLREGLVGTPGPINPLLASSAPDRTLSDFIYSGLMKATPSGDLVHELSSEHEVSEDATEYTFKLREDAVFHDGSEITAEDVVFTIEKVKDPDVRSTLAANWMGIKVEAVSEKTVKFKLSEPHPHFLELTTLGILPEHIWNSVDSNRFAFSSVNTEPIGAGPYKVSSVSVQDDGNPKEYRLEAFEEYVRGKPYISNFVFTFYPQEREAWMALQRKEIDALAGFSPQRLDSMARDDVDIKTTPLPRVFSIFINQNNNENLADADVRKALSMAIDREKILEEVLNGKGEIAKGPVPINITENEKKDEKQGKADIEKAEEMLEEAGWEYDEELGGFTKDDDTTLSVNISTVRDSDLQKAAEIVKNNWERMGVKTSLALYGNSELNQNVLRSREFEGLLFGYILERDMDLFPFWHSSERNDPGMNLSLYTNITVDELLEEYRSTDDPEKRSEIMEEINENVKSDMPAIFLYTPHFLYALPEDLQNADFGHLITPEERFLNVHEWFMVTDKVWSFLL
ncbi:MAG: ABC transporter substrate-binding protein [Patescibacteria group bacterium]